jgi:hypothetical protein
MVVVLKTSDYSKVLNPKRVLAVVYRRGLLDYELGIWNHLAAGQRVSEF